jgi:hypothetical protein
VEQPRARAAIGQRCRRRNQRVPRAIALQPEFEHAHWNLALALLLDGQYAEGWREYESRFALSELGKDRHDFAGPAWDGSAPQGKTLLLYTEQGLGDALQFARFIAPLARTGARCIVYCPQALAPLLATAPGVAQTVTNAERLPHYDAHLPLLSLPRLLGTTVDAIPATSPHHRRTGATRRGAQADRGLAATAQRRHRLDRQSGQSGQSHPFGGFDALDPLFEVEGIDWYSLQQGRTAAEFTPAAREARMRPLPADWALVDTAALIAELDLAISVCTSIAHLSGALGRPTWTMLACAADWRWLRGRADSPWYPTMRLFRQPHPRDWNAVARSIAFELRALVSALTDTGR